MPETPMKTTVLPTPPGELKVDPKLCARCRFSAACLPVGRPTFASQLLIENVLVSNWQDPTPCRCVDALQEFMKAFEYKEFKIPDAPQPGFDKHNWTVDWTYRQTFTHDVPFHTSITVS